MATKFEPPLLAIEFDSKEAMLNFLDRHGQSLSEPNVNVDPTILAKAMEEDIPDFIAERNKDG